MKSESDPITESENETEAHRPVERKTSWFRQSFNPFRIATVRGLAVLLPPLLTIMLFAWAWNTIDRVVLHRGAVLGGAGAAAVQKTGRDYQEYQGLHRNLLQLTGGITVRFSRRAMVLKNNTFLRSIDIQYLASKLTRPA